MDVIGPMSETTPEGYEYLLCIIDDHTRYACVNPLKSKSDVKEAVMSTILSWENQLTIRVKKIRTDRGTEFLNKELGQFLKQKGIVHQTTALSHLNKMVLLERFNRTLKQKVRCMLVEAELGEEFWAEAALTARLLRNISPVKNRTATPYELFTGRKPNISFLRIWGAEHMSSLRSRRLVPWGPGLFLAYL